MGWGGYFLGKRGGQELKDGEISRTRVAGHLQTDHHNLEWKLNYDGEDNSSYNVFFSIMYFPFVTIVGRLESYLGGGNMQLWYQY